jgi:hypothetical protein
LFAHHAQEVRADAASPQDYTYRSQSGSSILTVRIMNERERWVVYPLLFLALGAALRDKLVDQTSTKSIKCQELLVVDQRPLGEEVLLARIGGTDSDDASQPSTAEMVLRGQFTIVDPHGVTKLVSMGRDERRQTAPPKALVAVQGQMLVDGPINAMHYLFRGVPFMPTLRTAVPGMPDFLPAAPASNPAQPEAPAADSRDGASSETPPPNGAEAPAPE